MDHGSISVHQIMSKAVNIGELDRRVDLYRFTETVSDTGEHAKSWTLIKSCFAKYEPISGTENITAGQPTPVADVAFVVRYDSSISEADRIVFHSTNWNIFHIEEVERLVFMRLLCNKPDNQ